MRGWLFVHIVLVFLASSCDSPEAAPEKKALVTEEQLNHFIANPQHASAQQRSGQLDSILADVSTDGAAFKKIISLLTPPLSDPNSPYRNEELYIQLLSAQLHSAFTDSLRKPVIREKLFLLMQNRPGETANDFIYLTPQGMERKMSDTKAAYTLLFFYNPECEACKEMKASLIQSAAINTSLKNGRLALLAIYTDKDQTAWRNHLSENPPEWINGSDINEYLFKNNVYNLHAIPTIYLLGSEKRVLLKDCMEIKSIEEKILRPE